ncbi:translation initiation factor IF-2 [Parabacteroides bouchesdurhonensis]|uniref:translation initiation factor IF-2 n=1 Tax=Parabacteroides bouchesdurhonensis TaxID=1936995 RepID=UPI000E513142|nr:translation initiation factor IF-2 [Parabacteroides bouchesdurhonensis]RHJ93030.1 translation initiation factor IF-2 [Bacteroides sp. AM07-16]
MPIKLIQVQRKLNVGINTVVEFLRRKGFSVEDNPNTRISDEQYALLVKEFGKDLPEKGHEQTTVAEHVNKETPSVKEEKASEIKTEVPKDLIPKFVTKGRIELDGPHKKNQEEEEETVVKEEPVVKQEQPEPVAPVVEPAPVVVEKPEPAPVKQDIKVEEKKVVKNIVVEKEKAEEKQPEVEVGAENVNSDHEVESIDDTIASGDDSGEAVFRLNTPKFESKIKVTGKIDLNALNQSTRPKKKTKEEKKKERDEKQKFTGNKPNNPNGPFKPKDGTAKPGAPVKQGEEGDAKKKRKRIKKDRVDVNNTPGTNFTRPQRDDRKPRLKKPVKAEVSEEDVQKQIKETLARLTNKGNKNNKGAKYRRDKREAIQKREHEQQEREEQESKTLKLTEFVTANDLANMMDVPVTQVIATCMSIGIMVSINQRLDAETINIVVEEFGFKTEYVSAEVVEAINADDEEDNEDDWVARPPIVTVMGHVDHGKTSLLDNIRNANVIAGEAGGITQHIGAYNVKLPSGRRITFLDTPGHEAFTAMRARGAKVTDIAIIIVAADDSVMPQTIEAINHASAAGVPIVFAINKIDKPHANPEKIKEELANMNYLVEDWGGKYQSQEISAKKGIGVKELLEKVLLEADLLDLKANPNKRATGSIIESSLDKGRGYVSTILVENGTLKMSDIVLAGTHYGRIKAMFNERNQRVEKAGPSEPVMILGLNGAPQAGDTFNVLETEQEAREIATRREQLQRELGLRTQKMLTLDDIGRRIAVGNFQELNVIVKGDVDGSVEALSDSLIRLSTEEIQVNVIHKAVGQISESDVVLAAASNAIIIGFQVRPSLPARRNAEKEGVEIRLYSIIYDAIEEVKDAMEGMLSPEIKEEITANVEVQQVFKISKVGTIAGCIVKEGKIKRTNKVRVIRDGIVIHSGELGSLKRFKDDVKEVVSGQDCGLNINNFNDIQVGDIIEAYEETEIKKTL